MNPLNKIIIEKDGKVTVIMPHVLTNLPKAELGLGDIDVDVVIEDKRV